ncbi:MAG: CoA ester lyase [Spirochaetaceae bacterium]|nr:CoA ester lyase [Spirochaetaceae bacterium]
MKSWLYCPGDVPGKMINAGIYDADGIVLDLEDSVSPDDKDEARILVSEALAGYDFGPAVVTVRVNGTDSPWWREDIRSVIKAGAGILRLPKMESAEALKKILTVITEAEERKSGSGGGVRIQCILETPAGIENAFEIAGAAAGRLTGFCFGAEDYCTAVGIGRPGPDYALDYPRSRVASAAASAGVECYDTVWSNFRDPEGLRSDALRARSLGFSGKSLIHPDQIAIVNEIFSPTEKELEWACRVVENAGESGRAVAIDGGMVDLPVLRRARNILNGKHNERN